MLKYKSKEGAEKRRKINRAASNIVSFRPTRNKPAALW